MVLSDKIRDNGNTLEHGKSCINIRKKLYCGSGGGLVREAMGSPCLQVFRTHLHSSLCNLLWRTCFSRVIGLDDLHGVLSSPYSSVIFVKWEASLCLVAFSYVLRKCRMQTGTLVLL